MPDRHEDVGMLEGAPPPVRLPVAAMVESIIGCKWSVRLLQLCAGAPYRPSAILRACPGLSAKVMNERLRKLTRFGILQRTVCGAKPPLEVHYLLTPFGRRFLGILDAVHEVQEDVDRGAIGGPTPPAPARPPRLRYASGSRRKSG